MFDAIIRFFEPVVAFIGTQLILVLAYPLVPGQRIFWVYLCTSIMLAFFVFRVRSRSTGAQKSSIKAFVGFLLPKEIWRTSSAWLDVRYFFFHQIFRLVIYGAFLTGVLNLVFQTVTGGPSLIAASALTNSGLTGIGISTAYMVALVAFVDLVSYGIHYFQHKVPVLWEFHKVHHSLEVMHPLSNYREHPIDNIVYATGTGAAYGLFMGLAANLLGTVPSMPQLLGIPLLMLAFNLLGYNLRHSHVWLRWPGRWSMVFASPAHHHIHHSCHADHIDKNFAFIFPFWDVLFRTYTMPETNEDVRFGISANYVNEYKSCLGIYFIPFKNVWRRYSKGETAPLSPPGDPI
ncbi:MAG: sterol desaturase family protein [Alphaproteobacteria bacterium]